jgi:hypothetical protein
MGHVVVTTLGTEAATHAGLSVCPEFGTGFAFEHPGDHFLNFFSGQAGDADLKADIGYDSVSYVTHYSYLALL